MTAPQNEGSFARTASGASGRGLILIIIVLAVGFFVLNNAFDDSGDAVSAGGVTETTAAGGGDDPTTPTSDPSAPSTTGIEGGTPTTDPGTTEPTLPPVTGARPPADTKVQVANGARVGGIAGTATQGLAAQGYQVGTPTNLLGDEVLAETKIYVETGWLAEAQGVAQLLGITDPSRLLDMPAEPPVAQFDESNILVILGTDFVDP